MKLLRSSSTKIKKLSCVFLAFFFFLLFICADICMAAETPQQQNLQSQQQNLLDQKLAQVEDLLAKNKKLFSMLKIPQQELANQLTKAQEELTIAKKQQAKSNQELAKLNETTIKLSTLLENAEKLNLQLKQSLINQQKKNNKEKAILGGSGFIIGLLTAILI